MDNNRIQILIAMVIYMAVVIGIGVVYAKRANKNSEAYFLGGLRKDELLKAFGAHIFFDDQDTHLTSSSKYVPSGKVPYYSTSQINDAIKKNEEGENG